jgi:hypothetical protein
VGPQGQTGATGPKGDTGATGAAATITVGTVTTGAAGSSATVTNTGSNSAAVLSFTIPAGAKGDKGDTGATGPAGPVALTVYAGNIALTGSSTDLTTYITSANFLILKGGSGTVGSLPTTGITSGRLVYIRNTNNNAVTVNSVQVAANATRLFIFDGSAWVVLN